MVVSGQSMTVSGKWERRQVERKGAGGTAERGSVTGPSLPRMCLWPLHPSERSVFLFSFLAENWVSLPLSFPSQLLGGETPLKAQNNRAF